MDSLGNYFENEIAVKHTDGKEMFSMLFGEIWDSIEKHPSIKNFKDCAANNSKQQSGSVDSSENGQKGGIQP